VQDDRDGAARWVAVDPKAVVGDPAWDPWLLMTQIGEWIRTVPPPVLFVERALWCQT
jgi:streptomycin 6-kinase